MERQMVSRLEIRLKKELVDAEGRNLIRKAKDYFGFELEDVRVIKVLTIDADLDDNQLEMIRREIFTNPVTEESSFSPIAKGVDWLIWIGFRPCVRRPAGSTAVEAIEDLLNTRFKSDESVYTSKLYDIRGRISEAQAGKIAAEILGNGIIQQYRLYSMEVWNPVEGIGN